MRNRFLLLIQGLFLVAFLGTLSAQVQVSFKKGAPACFPLASEKATASVYFETGDYISTQTTARLFAEDVERVTGNKPALVSSKSTLADYMVINFESTYESEFEL